VEAHAFPKEEETAPKRTKFMGQLMTKDGESRTEASRYVVGKSCSDGHSVREVVQAVAHDHHPCDA